MKSSDTSLSVAGFEAFRELARNAALSPNEKSGFAETVRQGKTEVILQDVLGKLTCLDATDRAILNIGPGCSDFSLRLLEFCQSRRHRIVLVDSQEMLDQIPETGLTTKIVGRFPECLAAVEKAIPRYNAILAYSVVQYVFAEANLWDFVDQAASLLEAGGQFLIGDIPNASFRKRFLASDAGRLHHRLTHGDKPFPELHFNQLDRGEIDDGVVIGLLSRLRSGGYNAFVVPQHEDLPMANRREDILVLKA